MSILFEPITLGNLTLNNRIIMAPLTRCRSTVTRIPNALMAQYYSQRASAGLIITEATSISPMAVGYPNTPGIWSDAQIEGWKVVTNAVHEKGGKIFLQLWHVGRISDPEYLEGKQPVSASNIAAEGHPNLLRPIRPFVAPRALALSEISSTIEDYKQAAINAKKAGFDGVELHGANGYLLDQFLQDNCNKRTDNYGGSLENRARFMLEATDAVIDVWGPERVGMHLAPRCDTHSMSDSNPLKTFSYVASELGKRKIAFICSRASLGDDNLAKALKDAFGGPYIINQGLSQKDAEDEINAGHADAVAWGKLFIANPDLPKRFQRQSSLNVPNPELFYSNGPEGYTDYPSLETP
jgi:2,4-dienoyl-CoA reductase-like NADH-dependent reductase (Old Yellow Enzyme family)